MATDPAASRRNDASTRSTASAASSRDATSASDRYSGIPLASARLADEADLAVRLEHGETDAVDPVEPLEPCLREQFALGDPLAAEVLRQQLAVLDEDHRLAVEQRPQARELERAVRDRHRHQRDRAASEHQPRDGEVVLRDSLLDEVADHHEQEQVERLHRRQLAPADDAREQEHEREAD